MDRLSADGLLIAISIQDGQMESKKMISIPVQNERRSIQVIPMNRQRVDWDRQEANERSSALREISVVEKILSNVSTRLLGDRPLER